MRPLYQSLISIGQQGLIFVLFSIISGLFALYQQHTHSLIVSPLPALIFAVLYLSRAKSFLSSFLGTVLGFYLALGQISTGLLSAFPYVVEPILAYVLLGQTQSSKDIRLLLQTHLRHWVRPLLVITLVAPLLTQLITTLVSYSLTQTTDPISFSQLLLAKTWLIHGLNNTCFIPLFLTLGRTRALDWQPRDYLHSALSTLGIIATFVLAQRLLAADLTQSQHWLCVLYIFGLLINAHRLGFTSSGLGGASILLSLAYLAPPLATLPHWYLSAAWLTVLALHVIAAQSDQRQLVSHRQHKQQAHWQAQLQQGSHSYQTLQDQHQNLVGEHHKTSESLIQTRRRLEDTQRIAQIGDWEWNLPQDQFSWSNQLAQILHLHAVEPVQSYKTILASIDQRDRSYVDNAVVQALKNKQQFRIEFRITSTQPPHSSKLLEVHAKVLCNHQGHPSKLIGTLQDITERRRTHMLNQRLGRVVDESHEEFYVFDATHLQLLQANQGALNNLGYSHEQLITHTMPELQPEFTRKSLQQRLDSLKSDQTEQVVYQTWQQRSDYSQYPVEVRVHYSRLEIPPVYLAIVTDISERLKAEQRLRLAEQVFDNSSEGILISDNKGIIQEVNPAFCQITGYSARDLVGKNSRILRSPQQGERFYREIWSIVREVGRWQGEVWNRRKNGHVYAEWLSISMIRDKHNKPSRYIAIINDITERKINEDKIYHLAHYDALTNLPNRVLFHERLRHAIVHAQRSQQHLAVLFLDLDQFKAINDTMGHASGDALLQQASARLTRQLRRGDTIARMGGDEFTIILENIAKNNEGLDAIMNVAHKINHTLADAFQLSERNVFVSGSIGIALYPQDGDNAEELIKNADTAMYHAKAQGRNTYQLFSAEMNAKVVARLDMENNLRSAIDNQELFLVYQPQIDTQTGHIVGVEALLRWHSQTGLIPPGTFIPIAEESGLIVPIGAWVLHTACQQMRHWQQQHGIQQLRLAVNLSARQFRDPEVIPMIQQALRTSGLAPEQLELEITETLLMEDSNQATHTLTQLHQLGVRLAIDDFGTGYSSLGYLRRFPIHMLKIDRSFIGEIEDNSDDKAIVSAIIAMGHSLDIDVLAEGVETGAQHEFLKAKQCNLLQGYLFSPPLPADAFARFYERNLIAGGHISQPA